MIVVFCVSIVIVALAAFNIGRAVASCVYISRAWTSDSDFDPLSHLSVAQLVHVRDAVEKALEHRKRTIQNEAAALRTALDEESES